MDHSMHAGVHAGPAENRPAGAAAGSGAVSAVAPCFNDFPLAAADATRARTPGGLFNLAGVDVSVQKALLDCIAAAQRTVLSPSAHRDSGAAEPGRSLQSVGAASTFRTQVVATRAAGGKRKRGAC